jgi:hypothetical protein
MARAIRRLFVAIAVLAAGMAHADAGRTPKPTVSIAQPGQCVAATELMRRDHMELLKHQRDRTMRAGVRTPQYSLNGCVECHASAKTGSVLGPEGFCQSCHSYAAVKLDCFECHASKPGATRAAGVRP